MATNKPSFLNGIDETPEEKEIMDVLRDEPEDTPVVEEKTNENEPPTKENEVVDNPEDKPKDKTGDETTPPDGKTGDEDSPADETTPPDEKKEDKPAPDATKPNESKAEDETIESAAKRQIELKFGTFKTPEDAEKAFKEMQRTLTRLTTQKKPEATPGKQTDDTVAKFINIAKNQPLVDVRIPKSENYKLDDGSFDLDSYGKDLVKNTIMAIQQSLIGGQLGSMQFGILQQAMNEEYRDTISRNENTNRAAALEQKIQTTYPIFKTNEKASELLERAIYGEASRRQMLAAKEGKEPEKMTEADFMQLAEDLVKNFNIPVKKQEEEQTDKPGQTPTLQPTQRQRPSEIDSDIEGMLNVKNKSGSIF